MTNDTTSRQRVAVVGASTGLGRCIGTGLAQRGERVALLARSTDKLADAVAESGDGAVAIACDATDQAATVDSINAAADALGGLDTVLYAAAVGPLTAMADATPDQWSDTFATNVIGASNVTQAALPYLRNSAGNMVFMSTTGASYTGPWGGLGVYQVTKAAMNRMVDHWRVEQPGIDFTTVTIGECAGGEGDRQTQFNAGWDPEVAAAFYPDWFARQHMSGALINIEHLVDQFHALVTMGRSMQVPSMVVIPRPPIS